MSLTIVTRVRPRLHADMYLIKVTLLKCEKSVVQFDSTKHRKFSPGTSDPSCSSSRHDYWTSRENSLGEIIGLSSINKSTLPSPSKNVRQSMPPESLDGALFWSSSDYLCQFVAPLIKYFCSPCRSYRSLETISTASRQKEWITWITDHDLQPTHFLTRFPSTSSHHVMHMLMKFLNI